MDDANQPRQSGMRRLLLESRLAIAMITLWPVVAEREWGDAGERGLAMMFVPAAGFAVGMLMAAADRAMEPVLGIASRSVAVLAVGFVAMLGMTARGIADLAAALRYGTRLAPTGLARIGPFGASAAIVAFALEAAILSQIGTDGSRAVAIVLSQMLGRWVIVPVGYGLKPLERWGLGVPYDGAITMAELAVSSAIAMAIAVAIGTSGGLVAIAILALAILAMRAVIRTRLGGAAGYALGGASGIAEIVVLAVFAALRF